MEKQTIHDTSYEHVEEMANKVASTFADLMRGSLGRYLGAEREVLPEQAQVTMHPHRFMRDFLKKYEDIRSYLEVGDLDSVGFVVLDMVSSLQEYEKYFWNLPVPAKGTYGRYILATRELEALLEERADKRLVQRTFPHIDRRASELSMLLKRADRDSTKNHGVEVEL
ncbi:MAG: hypothetical protein KKC19_01400 [Nanoarchaeota archaeon]|nr:hypothetical protein [Nanoarchaeota archaeon]